MQILVLSPTLGGLFLLDHFVKGYLVDPTTSFSIAISLVATLFGLLVLVLGWLGNKIYTKLDSLDSSVRLLESDLRGQISRLDRRITRIEALGDVLRVNGAKGLG